MSTRRLLVVEGADKGRHFGLCEKGKMVIGSSRKNADIMLNDLYVARNHCELDVTGNWIVARLLDDPHPIFVNGNPITEQELYPGDVLRVGNSQLMVEECDETTVSPAAGGDDVPEVVDDDDVVEVVEDEGPLPFERLRELEGAQVGHFQIEAFLGQGRLGAIFRALDEKTGQAVALKVLAPDFPGSDEELQRFARVLKPLLPIHHANIVAVKGAGKSGPYTWIAREHIEGTNAAQEIEAQAQAKKIDWRLACRVAVHIGRALNYAHHHNLVHHNLTPLNILIGDGGTTIKLADMLLVRALEGSKLLQDARTRLTPQDLAYQAPEKLSSHAFVDALSDLYSLGTVVYALATGRPPFRGKTADEVILKVCEGPVVKPSAVQKNIPHSFEAIILRMMARRQEDRYQTPAELLIDLDDIVEKRGVEV